MFIYKIFDYFAMIVAFLCGIALAYHAVEAICHLVKKEGLSYASWISELKYEFKEVGSLSLGLFSSKTFFILALLAAFITNATVHQLVGIHNLYLKPEGTYCFYVEANRSDGKVYTLPAKVRITKDPKEPDHERGKSTTYYYIEEIYFSNGGWLDTKDNEDVAINEQSYLYDSDGIRWSVVLLNEHAYSPHVEETNNAGWLGVTLALMEIVPIAFSLYILCRKDQQ